MEFRHVHQRTIGAEFGDWMRIGIQTQTQFLRTKLRAPHVGESQKEALVSGVTIQHWRFRHTFQRSAIGVVGQLQSA